MLKFTNTDDTKKNLTTKLILTENLTLDGAELIPVDCGGRLLAPTVSVNELGKQLLKAAAEGNVEKTKSLLNRGALFTADWLGASPLHLAARNNHFEVCEILLRAGISRDARTKVDKTPLHMAAYEGHISIVEILLEYNADPSCRDLLGMTPLHWAAQNGHLDVVKILLKRCFEIDPVNKFDLTPADLAAQINRLDIVEILNLNDNNQIPDPLSFRLTSENSNESNYQQNNEISPSTSNSPIPLETILMEEDEEENENSIDSDALNLNNTIIKDEQDQQQHPNIFAESMKLLQEHGITMLTNDDTNILTTVMETGHSVVLTDIGKEVLNSMKETEKKHFDDTIIGQKKKIITVTPEELLAMTTNSTGNRTSLFKQIDRTKSPKNNIKRIVMKKNKMIPISNTVNNMFKMNKMPGSTDMETVMTQLIEARKTIEEYKVKLLKKEQEAERYKQQLKLLMDES